MYLSLATMASKGLFSVGGSAIDLAATAGKKFIEIAIPAAKKASLISVSFVQGGISEVRNMDAEKNTIKLSKEVKIIDDGLSIPLSFSENQMKNFESKVTHDLNVIKGQNEIIFLSNSISYFIESHAVRTGLDRSISYALQYDIAAVRSHLNANRDIRFPGYLLHQCSSLAETIKELNIFYASVLSHGVVPDFTEDFVSSELSRRFGAAQRKGDLRSYIPYELQLPFLREIATEKKKGMTVFDKFFRDNKDLNISEINDFAHESLFLLSEELIANEELEFKLNQKVSACPDNKIVVESFSS